MATKKAKSKTMKLKIKTIHEDGYDDEVEIEYVDTDQDLLGSVAKFNDMSREGLQKMIDTGRWFGGKFSQDSNRIIFQSDVFHNIFSLVTK